MECKLELLMGELLNNFNKLITFNLLFSISESGQHSNINTKVIKES